MELACQSSLPAPARVFNHGKGDVMMAMHGMESVHVAGFGDLLSQTSVGLYSASGWAVTTCLGMWVAILQCLAHRSLEILHHLQCWQPINEYHLVFECQACSTSEADTLGCLCTGQWPKSCGRKTCNCMPL